MKKTTSYSFDHNYRVHASIVLPILKILLFEACISIFYYILNVFVSSTIFIEPLLVAYIKVGLWIVNVIVVILLMLAWHYRYYIVSPESISAHGGIIIKHTMSCDIAAIRSVVVNQGLFGKLFGYGTVTLKSPLLDQNFILKSVPKPFKHANLIEKSRLDVIARATNENIIPTN